jgi:hypothetical protein
MRDTTISRDPLLRGVETSLCAVYYPLGFPLEIETNDARVLARAQESFDIFRAPPSSRIPPFDPAATSPFPAMHLRAVCDPRATAAPPWPAHSYRASRDLFTLVSSPENFLIGDLERRQATGFFSPALLEDSDYFCTDFLESFAYMTIQRHWATPIHAACVVRNGVGICLAGNSTSGKSTLGYFCAKAGAALLADNSVWFLNQGENRRLLGNPARVRLRVESRQFFPELNSLPVSQRADGGDFVAVRPGNFATEATPGPIVFLERGGSPALIPIPAEEARRRLFLDRNPRIDEPHVMRECERVIGEAANAGAYTMRYATLEQAWQLLQDIPLERKHS